MDPEALRVEYVSGKLTYTQIAEKHGISKSQVARIAKRDNWRQQRDAFRKSVATKALNNLRDRGARQLERLIDTTDRLNSVLERITGDRDQFFRWKSDGGTEEGPKEYILSKADTKALKNATAALNEMVRVTRNLYGLPDRMEERKDRREERRLKVLENRDGHVDENNAGIILMPQILPEEPEDAPEVNS